MTTCRFGVNEGLQMVMRANGEAPALYWQLAERVRGRIADGHYADGSQLPTEEALGREFGVSRITVRSALDRLAAEGVVRRERGRGTFVATRPVALDLGRFTDFAEDMAATGLVPTSRVTHFAEEPASAEIAAQLGSASGVPIVRVDRLRLADDLPLAFDRTYLPLRYGRLLDRSALATVTILHQLEADFGIPILSGRYAIEAAKAADDVAAALEIAPGDPVLLVHRTPRTTGDMPVFYQQRHYRSDRVCYTVDLRRGPTGTPTQVVSLARRISPQ
jgi:GntR family transcriptional regulator